MLTASLASSAKTLRHFDDRFPEVLTGEDAAEGCRDMLYALDDVHFEFHARSEEHTSELQSQSNLVCRLLLEKKTAARRRGKKPPRFAPSMKNSFSRSRNRPSSRSAPSQTSPKPFQPISPTPTSPSTSPRPMAMVIRTAMARLRPTQPKPPPKPSPATNLSGSCRGRLPRRALRRNLSTKRAALQSGPFCFVAVFCNATFQLAGFLCNAGFQPANVP